jgi:phage-related protein (TIGR01555 family)
MNYTRFLSAIEARKRATESPALPIRELFAPAKTLGGKSANDARMAMDKALDTGGYYDLLTDYVRAIDIDGGRNIAFMGYAALSLLEQNPIIRIIVETLSREATRKWVELKGGEKEDDKRVTAVNEALDRYNIRGLFRDCAETAGFQGGCMLYIDTGELTDDELEAPLILKPQTVGKGRLKGFRKIEPMTVYPAPYNAHEPLKADYFDPTHYYVFGKKVHKTRLLKFTSNDLNIMLKPAYNFFGIPLSQLVLRYVQNFENSRDNAAKIVDNFSLWGLKTNMDQMLQGETADDVTKRLKTMLDVGLNFGIALVDKEAEEFFQITMPISGLEGLVAQQLELVALISSIPVTKLFGTPPKGFNATGESDIQNFYDRVKNWQERLFYKNFEKVRRVIELSEFGESYDDIVNEWLPLKEATPKETAEIQLIKAQRDAALLQSGALSAEDIRTRLSQDMSSDYANIDPADLPEAPEGYEDGGEPEDNEGKAEDEKPAKWITVKGKRLPLDKNDKPMNKTGEKTLGKGESSGGEETGGSEGEENGETEETPDDLLKKHNVHKAARIYLDRHYRGKVFTDKAGTQVTFTGKGIGEIASSARAKVVKVLPHLKDVIEKGEIKDEPDKKTQENKPPRTDYNGFREYTHRVTIDTGKYDVVLKAGKPKDKGDNVLKSHTVRAHKIKTADALSRSAEHAATGRSSTADDESIPEVWEIVNINVEEI